MPRIELEAGSRFTVCAWGDDEYCEVVEFLKELQQDGNNDAARLVFLFKKTASNGPPSNIQQCRHERGGIYAFKAPNGARVLWFYDKGKIIICTHGFTKKTDKVDPAELDKADSIRKKYKEEFGDE